MKGNPAFVRVLMRYGQKDLLELLQPFGRIANLAEDTPEHAMHPAMLAWGPRSAAGFWKFLNDLPGAVKAATPEEFVIGYEPLGEGTDADLAKWDQWRATFYRMAIDPAPAKMGDLSSLKYRAEFIRLVYDEMDRFLAIRILFWLKKLGAPEDGDYLVQYGDADPASGRW